MLLSELAAASGVSAASIKYYRREGLLPAGERVTATRQAYGQAHLERLGLIQVLREVAETPISRIRALTTILDDPARPLIDALAEAQRITLGVDQPDAEPDATEEAAASLEHPAIGPLLRHLGWPDVESAPRQALDQLLHSLDSWGAPTHLGMLLRYAEPMAEIARADVHWMGTAPGPGGPDPGDGSAGAPDHEAEPRAQAVSDDVLVMRAVAGANAYDRLVQLLRALGHASFSVLRSTGTTDPSPDR